MKHKSRNYEVRILTLGTWRKLKAACSAKNPDALMEGLEAIVLSSLRPIWERGSEIARRCGVPSFMATCLLRNLTTLGKSETRLQRHGSSARRTREYRLKPNP